jgi:hypothetical protein
LQQTLPPPAALLSVIDRLAALGWSGPSSTPGCPFKLWPGVGGRGEFVNFYFNAQHEWVILTFYGSGSAAELRRDRDAHLAVAARNGYRLPTIDGNRFYMAVGSRAVVGMQKDLVGWIVPGQAMFVVEREAKLPVSSDARSFLNQLTVG